MVFLAREPSRRTLDVMLEFAAGVMIAASFWPLLAPSIEMSAELGLIPRGEDTAMRPPSVCASVSS